MMSRKCKQPAYIFWCLQVCNFEWSLWPLTFPITQFKLAVWCYSWLLNEAGMTPMKIGPVGLCTGPNWSQASAFYCLWNSSPVEGLHSENWNELEPTMWVTTMKASKGDYGWKQPACVGPDHHIWMLELMSMNVQTHSEWHQRLHFTSILPWDLTKMYLVGWNRHSQLCQVKCAFSSPSLETQRDQSDLCVWVCDWAER